jgi:arsenate reductase-like glutaredoxin family protein
MQVPAAKEVVDATKVRMGPAEVRALLPMVTKIIATRGKSVVTIDLAKEKPDEETLLSYLLGPTGNLKAPTIRVKKTLLVGFHQETYQDFLG